MNIFPMRQRAANPPMQFRKEMNDLWGRFFGDDEDGWFTNRLPEVFGQASLPAVNITEGDKTLTVAVDLPGVEAKDVTVEMVGTDLVIAGERKWESKKEDKDVLRTESQFGVFRRVVPLPMGLKTEADEIEAKYENGILEICLKKVTPTPHKKISVKTK